MNSEKINILDEICPECGGTGKIFILNAHRTKVRSRCPYCSGTGNREKEKNRTCECKDPVWVYSKSSDYSVHCNKCFKPLVVEEEESTP